jgi:hypothetical protein
VLTNIRSSQEIVQVAGVIVAISEVVQQIVQVAGVIVVLIVQVAGVIVEILQVAGVVVQIVQVVAGTSPTRTVPPQGPRGGPELHHRQGLVGNLG